MDCRSIIDDDEGIKTEVISEHFFLRLSFKYNWLYLSKIRYLPS